MWYCFQIKKNNSQQMTKMCLWNNMPLEELSWTIGSRSKKGQCRGRLSVLDPKMKTITCQNPKLQVRLKVSGRNNDRQRKTDLSTICPWSFYLGGKKNKEQKNNAQQRTCYTIQCKAKSKCFYKIYCWTNIHASYLEL